MTVAQVANIADVAEMYKAVAKVGAANYIVSLVMLRGLAEHAKLPSLAVIRETVERLRRLREKLRNQTELILNNFPLCLLGDDRNISANYPTYGAPGAGANYELMIHLTIWTGPSSHAWRFRPS